MFGKLMKHEFAATWRIMLLLNAILLGVGMIGFVFMWFISMQYERNLFDDRFSWTGVYSWISFFVFFVIALVTINIIARVYLIVRYYKNLYTSEGYLTFTLPATTTGIISAKVLTGMIWSFLTFVFTAGAVLLAFAGLVASSAELEEIAEIPSEILEVLTLEESRLAPILIMVYVISAITSILVFYFCITVGQLWAKHKILGAVLCYVLVMIVNRIITFFMSLGTGFSGLFLFGLGTTSDDFFRAYQRTLVGTLIYTIVLAVLYYLGCILITKKRVNLD